MIDSHNCHHNLRNKFSAMKNYYEELGVEPYATKEQIERAYRWLAQKFHPDRNADRQEEAKARFIRIQEAFDILSDPVKRAKYDQELRRAKQPNSNASAAEKQETEQPAKKRKKRPFAISPFWATLVICFAVLAVSAMALRSLSDVSAPSLVQYKPGQQLPADKSFIPADSIKVTASSTYEPWQDVIHLVDGSGMDGLAHDNASDAHTMWHSLGTAPPSFPATGLEISPAWVRFDFTEPQKFSALMIWNHNQDELTHRGFRKTHIYGTLDGEKWFSLTDEIELPRAEGSGLEYPIEILNVAAAQTPIKSVIIAAAMKDGNYGNKAYGLSAVRFVVDVDHSR
jgi:curved DNA-binding protein CbpA